MKMVQRWWKNWLSCVLPEKVKNKLKIDRMPYISWLYGGKHCVHKIQPKLNLVSKAISLLLRYNEAYSNIPNIGCALDTVVFSPWEQHYLPRCKSSHETYSSMAFPRKTNAPIATYFFISISQKGMKKRINSFQHLDTFSTSSKKFPCEILLSYKLTTT